MPRTKGSVDLQKRKKRTTKKPVKIHVVSVKLTKNEYQLFLQAVQKADVKKADFLRSALFKKLK